MPASYKNSRTNEKLREILSVCKGYKAILKALVFKVRTTTQKSRKPGKMVTLASSYRPTKMTPSLKMTTHPGGNRRSQKYLKELQGCVNNFYWVHSSTIRETCSKKMSISIILWTDRTKRQSFGRSVMQHLIKRAWVKHGIGSVMIIDWFAPSGPGHLVINETLSCHSKCLIKVIPAIGGY